MDGAFGNNVEFSGRFRKSPRAVGFRKFPGKNPSYSLTVASNVQVPSICAKAGLAIAMCGKTVCDRLSRRHSGAVDDNVAVRPSAVLARLCSVAPSNRANHLATILVMICNTSWVSSRACNIPLSSNAGIPSFSGTKSCRTR